MAMVQNTEFRIMKFFVQNDLKNKIFSFYGKIFLFAEPFVHKLLLKANIFFVIFQSTVTNLLPVKKILLWRKVPPSVKTISAHNLKMAQNTTKISKTNSVNVLFLLLL